MTRGRKNDDAGAYARASARTGKELVTCEHPGARCGNCERYYMSYAPDAYVGPSSLIEPDVLGYCDLNGTRTDDNDSPCLSYEPDPACWDRSHYWLSEDQMTLDMTDEEFEDYEEETARGL